MKLLALTVLVSEGPIARAYLGQLYAAGYQVERIVLLVWRHDLGTGKPLASWLPAAILRLLAKNLQDLRMNYWPRQLLRRNRCVFHSWMDEFAKQHEFDAKVWTSLTERASYTKYAPHVDELLVDDIADPTIARYLSALGGSQAVLFTGGGKVPSSLLDVPNCRFLHVHPGVLPLVGGADGLLWSLILRRKAGATAFYMNDGLDKGDIIASTEFKLPHLPPEIADWDTTSCYRFVYSFVDPMLRALLLLRIVRNASCPLHALPATEQPSSNGVTFHFMNDRIRRYAFERWFSIASPKADTEK